MDFPVDLSCVLLNVEGGWVAAGACPHEEISSLILEAIEFRWVLVELQMPELLFLHTLRVLLEVSHEVLDFLNLRFGIGVQDLSQVLHEVEVGSHRVSQSCQLT